MKSNRNHGGGKGVNDKAGKTSTRRAGSDSNTLPTHKGRTSVTSATSSSSFFSSAQASDDEIRMSSFAELVDGKIRERIIKRMLAELHTKREAAPAEIEDAFDYAVKYVEEKNYRDDSEKFQIFLIMLSDVLHVKEDSIKNYFDLINVKFLPQAQEEGVEVVDGNDNMCDVDVDNEQASEVSSKDCVIFINSQGKFLTIEKMPSGEGLLVSNDHNRPKISKANMSKLNQREVNANGTVVVSLLSYLNEHLPNYNFSSSLFKHNVFGNWTISSYPAEVRPKVEMQHRFSPGYKLPEKESKYSRPILDVEMHPQYGPCVRCYLALPDRPRQGHSDKDVTQDGNGNVVLTNVNLMNFGDPLRALTWVEDYIKNSEHGNISEEKPIIRSFLIPVAEYQRTLQNSETIIVDADRAPGQVKIPMGNYQLKTVPGSLTSFTDRADTLPQDGNLKKLSELSELLIDQAIHPSKLAKGASIAHQHGREIENQKERYQADLEAKAKKVLEARKLSSDLSGFGLKPSSAAIPANAKYLDIFKVRLKAKTSNDRSIAPTESKDHSKSRIKISKK